jgi:hypothetical protein
MNTISLSAQINPDNAVSPTLILRHESGVWSQASIWETSTSTASVHARLNVAPRHRDAGGGNRQIFIQFLY